VATDEDNINIPFSAHYALFLGIQTDYWLRASTCLLIIG
jgi:hypothetical protein